MLCNSPRLLSNESLKFSETGREIDTNSPTRAVNWMTLKNKFAGSLQS